MAPLSNKINIIAIFAFILAFNCLDLSLLASAQIKHDENMRVSNALVILDCKSIDEFNSKRIELESLGIKAYHRFPPESFIGYVPSEIEGEMKKIIPGIKIIRRNGSNEFNIMTSGKKNMSVSEKIWRKNYIENDIGELSDSDDEIIRNYNDIFYPPKKDSSSLNILSTLSVSSAPYIPYGATSEETSEYLAGSVAVGVILPESDGHMEDWTQEEIDKVLASVQEGLDWWIQQVPSKANLSFTYEFKTKVSIPEEPLFGPNNQIINEYKIMNTLGYSGSSVKDFSLQTRQFDNDLRDKYKTNWAITVFYIDRSRGKGGVSFTNPGGPHMVIFSERNDLILTEEARRNLAFVFYAQYENTGLYDFPDYYYPDFCNWKTGYLKVGNGNAYGCGIDNCIMYSAVRPYLCTYTRGQMGTRDSDGDRIPDVLDTFPLVGITPVTSTVFADSIITLTGASKVSPLEVLDKNPGSIEEYKKITINTISSVEYRIDNGQWIKAVSSDGKFDGYEEYFQIKTPILSNGNHNIKVRAENSVGNKTINPASLDFTIASVKTTLSADPIGIDFEYTKGETIPDGKPLQIKFSDSENHNWQASNGGDFISLSQTSGTGDSIITTTVDIQNKNQGIYTDTIEIYSPGITGSLQALPVNLTVYGETVITTNIDKINISDYLWEKKHEENLNPPYEILKIRNTGEKPVQWEAEIDPTSSGYNLNSPWIKVFPDKGVTPSTVLIMLDKENRAPQDLSADIHIKSPTLEFNDVIIPVNFSLCSLPAIYEVIPKSGNPGDEITVTGKGFTNSPGTASLRFVANNKKNIVQTDSWSDNTITFQLPDISGNGYFEVNTDCGESNILDFFQASPDNIPQIETDTDSLKLKIYNDESRIVTETIMITNTGGGVLTWNFTSDVGWTSFIPKKNTGNGKTIIAMDFTEFSAGTYSASVLISAPFSNAKNRVKIPINAEIIDDTRPLVTTPEILSLSLSEAKYADNLVLSGERFGDGNFSKVTVGGKIATIVNWTETVITLTIPWGIPAGNANVTVFTVSGKSNDAKLKIIESLPVIEGIYPNKWKSGKILLLKGENFGETEGKVKVKKKVANVVGWTNETIYFHLPEMKLKKKIRANARVKTMYGRSEKYHFILKRIKKKKYKIIRPSLFR